MVAWVPLGLAFVKMDHFKGLTNLVSLAKWQLRLRCIRLAYIDREGVTNQIPRLIEFHFNLSCTLSTLSFLNLKVAVLLRCEGLIVSSAQLIEYIV